MGTERGSATGPRGGRGAVVGYLVLLVFVFIAFVVVYAEAERAKMADRQSCERVNVLRENQAAALKDQIKQTEATLKRSLGPLEAFREQAEEGLRLRRNALSRLRASVRDHPVKPRQTPSGRLATRPYAISCVDAYP